MKIYTFEEFKRIYSFAPELAVQMDSLCNYPGVYHILMELEEIKI